VNNGHPQGFDLDDFRRTYQYRGRKTLPGERIELYRHFKPSSFVGDKAASFGVYRAGYQEFIKERKRKGHIPATKWFFCSKPGYYRYLYRPFGALLIPLLLMEYPPDKASPPLRKIESLPDDRTRFSGGHIYRKVRVAYRFPIIIARTPNGEKTTRWFDYMSQIIDWDRADDIVKTDRFFVKHRHLSRAAWRVIAEDLFMKHHDEPYMRALNVSAKKLIGA
jgi:hypothetical protein